MSEEDRTDELRAFPFVRSLEMASDLIGIQFLAQKPVVRARLPDGKKVWVALSHETVRRVLTDKVFSRSAALESDASDIAPGVSMPDALTVMDGAEHAAIRKLVTKTFSPRMVERTRPWVEKMIVDMLNKISESKPPADLIEHFIAPIPMKVICQLLGVPYQDRDRFCEAADRQLATPGMFTIQEITDGIVQLQDYIRQLVETKRKQPGDDLTTELAKAADGGYLTREQLINNLFLILTAGHETTVSQLSNSLVTLLSSRERYELLHRWPELIPNAIEELLRYLLLGYTGLFIRIATKDLELGGQRIRAGQAVVPLGHVANRDPEVFGNPNSIDFSRSDVNGHLSFGAGPHFCLGAQLARMEMQIALTHLIQRFPTLRLAVPPEDLVWKPGGVMRRVITLPVEW